MKKLTLALAGVLAIGTSASAQKIGVHANGIVSTLSASADGLTVNSQSRFSWKVGLQGELPLSGNFKLMPQLNVLSKGGKFTEDGDGVTLKLTYVEVPLLFTYHFSKAFIGAGPSVSIGIGGEAVSTFDGETEVTKIKFDGNEDPNDEMGHLRRTDVGIHFIGGVKLPKGLFVNAHYNLGVTSIVPGENQEGKMTNRYFGFGIGKNF
ncbi:porin family protein [Flaviaesturariibacter amylovorans]|uniref:Outer membrane protein beta-barrel domain-containing protein n=1 Tax=Flaviaesturariibacter amylovorans TaxID=1084520 RepID=A0ABP8GXB5_9BACT